MNQLSVKLSEITGDKALLSTVEGMQITIPAPLIEEYQPGDTLVLTISRATEDASRTAKALLNEILNPLVNE